MRLSINAFLLQEHNLFGEAFEAETEGGSAPEFSVQELDSSAGEAGHNAFG